MVFRISDLECVLSHFPLRTNIRLAEFLPGLTCTHQLTAAPPRPSGAPEPCPTCWHLKPALGEHPQGCSVHYTVQRCFYTCLPPQGMEGHRPMQRRALYPKFSPVDPQPHLYSVKSLEVISTSCSLSVAPPSQEFAALPTLPMHNPVFQTQPIKLTSDLPPSCAWHAGSSSSTTGKEEVCQLAGIYPQREAPHVLGGCQCCSRASPSSQDLPSQRHLPFHDPCGTASCIRK